MTVRLAAICLSALLLPAIALAGITTTLRVGSTGPQVAELQRTLATLGLAPGLPATGLFDAATRAGLMQFQDAQGLPRTGTTGPRTRAALNAIRLDAITTPLVTPSAATSTTPCSDAARESDKIFASFTTFANAYRAASSVLDTAGKAIVPGVAASQLYAAYTANERDVYAAFATLDATAEALPHSSRYLPAADVDHATTGFDDARLALEKYYSAMRTVTAEVNDLHGTYGAMGSEMLNQQLQAVAGLFATASKFMMLDLAFIQQTLVPESASLAHGSCLPATR